MASQTRRNGYKSGELGLLASKQLSQTSSREWKMLYRFDILWFKEDQHIQGFSVYASFSM